MQILFSDICKYFYMHYRFTTYYPRTTAATTTTTAAATTTPLPTTQINNEQTTEGMRIIITVQYNS